MFSFDNIPVVRVLGVNRYGQEVRQTYEPDGKTPTGLPTIPGNTPHEGRIYSLAEFYHPDFDPEDDE